MAPLLAAIDTTGVMLGVGRSTVYSLLAAGSLEGRKLGKRTLVTVASIEAFVAGLPRADIRLGRRDAA